MNFSQTVEWTRVWNHAYDIFYDSWLLFVYKSYYFFVYISNFNFSNFIEYFANFLNHFNLYGFYQTDKPIERKICQLRRFPSPHMTLDLKKSTLIGWCQMQKNWIRTLTHATTTSQLTAPGSTYVTTYVNPTICTASKFNQSKSRKSVFRQQINFCFV